MNMLLLQGVSLEVNFGPLAGKNMPFVCRMIQDLFPDPFHNMGHRAQSREADKHHLHLQ